MALRLRRSAHEWVGRLRGSDGQVGVILSGHRDYVGGFWDQIGRLQFDFLVSEGLRPNHVFLDIGCGSLRGGVHFIPYLDVGHYLGIDKEKMLIRRGLRHELSPEMRKDKRPQFVISDAFEFERFDLRPDFAIAQSLFTHLPPIAIAQCLVKLKQFASDCRLYATFSETEDLIDNPSKPHSRIGFHYTREEMAALGDDTGWRFRFIGEWGHPRGQLIGEYR